MWYVSCACETMFRCFEVTWQGVSFSWGGEGLIVSSQNHRRTLQVCKMLQCDATTIVKYCNTAIGSCVKMCANSGRVVGLLEQGLMFGRFYLFLTSYISAAAIQHNCLQMRTLESKSWMQWLCFRLVPPPPICRDSLSRCGSKTLLLLVV